LKGRNTFNVFGVIKQSEDNNLNQGNNYNQRKYSEIHLRFLDWYFDDFKLSHLEIKSRIFGGHITKRRFNLLFFVHLFWCNGQFGSFWRNEKWSSKMKQGVPLGPLICEWRRWGCVGGLRVDEVRSAEQRPSREPLTSQMDDYIRLLVD